MRKQELEQRLEQLEHEGVYAPLSPAEYQENLSESVAIQDALGMWQMKSNIIELQ